MADSDNHDPKIPKAQSENLPTASNSPAVAVPNKSDMTNHNKGKRVPGQTARTFGALPFNGLAIAKDYDLIGTVQLSQTIDKVVQSKIKEELTPLEAVSVIKQNELFASGPAPVSVPVPQSQASGSGIKFIKVSDEPLDDNSKFEFPESILNAPIPNQKQINQAHSYSQPQIPTKTVRFKDEKSISRPDVLDSKGRIDQAGFSKSYDSLRATARLEEEPSKFSPEVLEENNKCPYSASPQAGCSNFIDALEPTDRFEEVSSAFDSEIVETNAICPYSQTGFADFTESLAATVRLEAETSLLEPELLEVDEVKLPCPYSKAGCSLDFDELSDANRHSINCKYRELPCLFRDCKPLVPYNDFILHLNKHHLSPVYSDQLTFDLILKLSDFTKDDTEYVPKWLRTYGQHFFLMLRRFHEAGLWMAWVYILSDDEEEAKKYTTKITIYKGKRCITGDFYVQHIRKPKNQVHGLVTNDENILDLTGMIKGQLFSELTINVQINPFENCLQLFPIGDLNANSNSSLRSILSSETPLAQFSFGDHVDPDLKLFLTGITKHSLKVTEYFSTMSEFAVSVAQQVHAAYRSRFPDESDALLQIQAFAGDGEDGNGNANFEIDEDDDEDLDETESIPSNSYLAYLINEIKQAWNEHQQQSQESSPSPANNAEDAADAGNGGGGSSAGGTETDIGNEIVNPIPTPILISESDEAVFSSLDAEFHHV